MATYNRPDLLLSTLRSISVANRLDGIEFQIFDDCSKTLSWASIRTDFPWITAIHPSDVNLGADGNLLRILEFFRSSSFTHLLFLDSDCVVRDDLFEFLLALPDDPKTVWSAYRSCFHSEGRSSDHEEFVEKASLGALGMFLSKNQVETFLSAPRPPSAVDWQLVFFFRSKGCRFFAPSESRVEHTGWKGAHNRIGCPDRAVSFRATNPQDESLLAALREKFRHERNLKDRCLDLYKTRMNSIFRFRLRSVLKSWGI
jgi:hypothetical protein